MKKVGLELQAEIVCDYLLGYPYKVIQTKFGVSRWNIQDALSKMDIKTNRIKSHPRLPGSKKKNYTLIDEYAPIPRPVNRYHDIDYLPPIKPNKNNPVLEDDLDIMERIDNIDDTGGGVEGSYKMVIDENGKARYEKC